MKMNDIPMTWEEFTKKLIQRGFEQLAPKTFGYKNNRDVIVVFSDGHIVIIIHDGKEVVKNYIILQVREHPDTFFWDGVYQDVLSRF